MKTRILLKSGCTRYLTNIIDTRVEPNINPKNVLVMSKFSQVFPKDLPRLPSDKDIEFVINLISSTEPISKAPYRMTSVQIKELKIQL